MISLGHDVMYVEVLNFEHSKVNHMIRPVNVFSSQTHQALHKCDLILIFIVHKYNTKKYPPPPQFPEPPKIMKVMFILTFTIILSSFLEKHLWPLRSKIGFLHCHICLHV